MVATLLPRVEVVLHRMAIGATLGIAAEVTKAFAIAERERPQAANHPKADRGEDCCAAKSKSAQGRLALRVDDIGIGGQPQTVSADVQAVPHELRGRGVGTGEAAKVGVGAAGGAVLGRVLGGNTKGAVIGGVVGAAGGAVVASQTASRDVVVKARTPVTFVLTQPLVAP